MKKIFFTGLILFFVLSCIYALPGKHKTQSEAKEIVAVSMRHGGCFGKCPQYMVEVHKNGLVRYTGFRFTKDSGMYEKNFGKAAVKGLFTSLAEDRVDTCKANYPNRIPDLSGLYYTIYYNNKDSQKINNAQGGPYFLKFDITKTMNGFANVDGTWKRITNAAAR